MRYLAIACIAALLACAYAEPSLAQAPAPSQYTATYPPGQLDQLVAPIALYPDALLSQVLMASTYPSDVTLAVAWAKAHQNVNGDAAVKAVENEPWDPSVQSLVAFPQVLAMMGAKPEWVQDLGDAFLANANGVMDAVQRLRAKAQASGSLQSNTQQVVSTQPAPPPSAPPPASAPPPPTQIITIQPANPQVVYVPTYNPTVVYGAWPYPTYPPYYIPPPPGWGFVAGAVTAGIAWGVGIGVSNALWGGINWGGGGNQININVNRYNNINVHNRITNNNWTHNSFNRNGVPYQRGPARDQYGHNIPPRYNNDRLYSGRGDSPSPTQPSQRDAERARAEQTLSGRVGAENMNRQALSNVDRNSLQTRGAGGPYGGGPRDFGSLSPQQARGNYDNAFRGANNAAQTREQMDRGAQSRTAMEQGRPEQQARPQQAREQRPQQQRRPEARPQPERRPAGGGARGGGGERRR